MGGSAGPEAVVQGREGAQDQGVPDSSGTRAHRLLVLRAGAASSASTPAFPSKRGLVHAGLQMPVGVISENRQFSSPAKNAPGAPEASSGLYSPPR